MPTRSSTAKPVLPAPPRARGARMLRVKAPETSERWLDNCSASAADPAILVPLKATLRQIADRQPWFWPQRDIVFISDVHADAEALLASLVLAGTIHQHGNRRGDFELTSAGRQACVLIGGDCLDKGPSNLKLLDTIALLRRHGATVVLLAGNHDLRLPLGLQCFERPVDTLTEHLFVRMGAKSMPLLREIWKRFVARRNKPLAGVPDKAGCLARLLPADDWPVRFREVARGRMPEEALNREIRRIVEKQAVFKTTYREAGMSIREVYAAGLEAHRLFMQPGGRYAWFMRDLKLMHREGSFLFVHAGLDDATAVRLAARGTEVLNGDFSEQFARDPFAFYAGSLGNSLRTKYRPVDYPLSETGVSSVHAAGIHMVVHGHRSNRRGQRLALREGLLHLEADITLDRNTRKKEGFKRRGGGATLVSSEGYVMGISADYPRAKVFNPDFYLSAEESRSHGIATTGLSP